jgi:acetyl-CoA carboxylase biotin carboxyl carrier protein
MIEVTTEMVANVVDVAVTVGATVAAGEPLLHVESMKMEIPVPAPVAGTVVEVRVGPGDTVHEGDIVAVLDPAATSSGYPS